MKRRITIIFLAVVLVAASIFWLLRVTPQTPNTRSSISPAASPTATQTQSSRAPEAQRFKQADELVEGIFSSPIAFYGRVIDQSGNPVPYANVGYTAADKFNASGSNYASQADEKGFFQITGINGAGLAVAVRKEGYYFVNETSDQATLSSAATFAYGMGPDSYRRPAPTKDKPAVFVLQKMGNPVPLVRLEKSTRIPKDGTPIKVDLRSGGLSSNGSFLVEAWTKAPTDGRKFSWRCRVSVPGGGLAERKDLFDFQAPIDGYEECVEITMLEDAAQWSSQQQRDYFVKLPDNLYARIKFRMIAGGNHYFVLESFLNPKPGDRNLEFDPAKAVKPP